ncbi:alpha/beta fold hydrolase [Salinifilum ghardaiensis]
MLGYRPAVLDAFLAPWRGDTGQAAFYRQYSQIKQEHTAAYEHLLGEITIPTRLIWGTEDRILPPGYARWLHDRIPHAELHWIEGAGHVLQEDAPAQLLAHLTSPFAQPAPGWFPQRPLRGCWRRGLAWELDDRGQHPRSLRVAFCAPAPGTSSTLTPTRPLRKHRSCRAGEHRGTRSPGERESDASQARSATAEEKS